MGEKHILSIDFDYIMFPCIKLYNDICSGDENSTIVWKNAKFVRGIDDQFLQYDTKVYHKLVKLVQLAMERDKSVELIPIDEHQMIVDDLRMDRDYNESTYDLVNIDFHHDIMYDKYDQNRIKRFGKYSCANWVGYLMMNNKLTNYTWIKAPNSDMYNCDYEAKFTIESSRKLDDLEALLAEHPFDRIYLCLSPQWVPYKYKHLYELILELFATRRNTEEE